MKCEKDYEEAITPIEDGDLLTITPVEHESTEKRVRLSESRGHRRVVRGLFAFAFVAINHTLRASVG